ncbi:T6SS immunity protein Tli4 family protein [Pseudomonas sp. NPDC012596]|uniref:T6SS immunity protein Tli4 family protein n=1 Tax=Pseudomonas sp. NPDC012596 TaxID=3364419 RepID=UPI00367A8D31
MQNLSVIILTALCAFSSSQSIAADHMDSHLENQNWKTHYFGRFSLSLPKDSEISADYKIFGANIELISKNARSELPNIVNQQIDALKKGTAKGTAHRYQKTIPLDNESTLLLSHLTSLYTFNVYLITNKNTAYHMMVRNISEEGMPTAVERMRMLSDAIYFRHPDSAPPAEGFALEAGYTLLDKTRFYESVYMGAQIKEHSGTYISLLTKGIEEKENTLIQRFEAKQYDASVGDLMKAGTITVLRKNKRTAREINGEEIALSANADGKKFYAFQFEHEGTIGSNTRPYIALELGTHEKGSDFASDEEALAFWDDVLNSLRSTL